MTPESRAVAASERLSRRPNVIWDDVDGTMTLCDTDTGAFLELNDPGAVVWRLCEGRSVQEIATALHSKHSGVKLHEVYADVEAFTTTLVAGRFLEIALPSGEERVR